MFVRTPFFFFSFLKAEEKNEVRALLSQVWRRAKWLNATKWTTRIQPNVYFECEDFSFFVVLSKIENGVFFLLPSNFFFFLKKKVQCPSCLESICVRMNSSISVFFHFHHNNFLLLFLFTSSNYYFSERSIHFLFYIYIYTRKPSSVSAHDLKWQTWNERKKNERASVILPSLKERKNHSKQSLYRHRLLIYPVYIYKWKTVQAKLRKLTSTYELEAMQVSVKWISCSLCQFSRLSTVTIRFRKYTLFYSSVGMKISYSYGDDEKEIDLL